MEGGIRALAELAVLRERPTAIMCSNDMTAIGGDAGSVRVGDGDTEGAVGGGL